MIFCKARRAQLKEEHPELPFGQLGAKLGEIWRNLGPEDKKPYEDQAAADRERYRKEMEQYQNGTLVRQLEPKKKKKKRPRKKEDEEEGGGGGGGGGGDGKSDSDSDDSDDDDDKDEKGDHKDMGELKDGKLDLKEGKDKDKKKKKKKESKKEKE